MVEPRRSDKTLRAVLKLPGGAVHHVADAVYQPHRELRAVTQRDVHRVFRDELRLGGHYRPSGAALRQLIAGTLLHVGVVNPRDHKRFHKALDKCGLPGTHRPHNTKHESAVGTRRYIAVDICISHNKASALMFSFVRVYEQRRQFMTSVAGYRGTACYMKSIIW